MDTLDIYHEFITENIQETPLDMTNYIKLIEMYDVFKSWFKDAFPGNYIPDRFTFRNNLIQRWGPMTNKSFYCIKFIDTDINF